MSQVNFDLQPEWLRRHEIAVVLIPDLIDRLLPAPNYSRDFQVSVGGDDFVLSVRHAPKPAAEMFSTIGETLRKPTDAEVLFLLARAFLGSLPQYPPVEPDVEKGWNTYRRALLEAGICFDVPTWDQLSSGRREACAIGIRAAFQPSTINPPPSTSR